MSIVQKGDTVIVPAPDGFVHYITIEWSQSFTSHKADYYALVGTNEKDKSEVVFFIQAEYYNNDQLDRIAEKVDNGYKVKLDGNFQYGQADATGKGRFVVYHDKDRKPYQHRFVKSTLASKISSAANAMAQSIGGPSAKAADLATSLASNIFGDYLKNF